MLYILAKHAYSQAGIGTMFGPEFENASPDEHIAKYTMAVTVRLTRINAHRIRRFEQHGLLKPARTQAGQRLYCDMDLDLISEIARLEQEGVNLRGILVILAMRRGERE